MKPAAFPSPPFAKTAVMQALARRGGSLRISPLLRSTGLSVDDLCATLSELAQRRWLTVTWRRTPHPRSPERLRSVERITATRFGRWRTPRISRPAPAKARSRARPRRRVRR